MNNNNGLPIEMINPLVGDTVRIYHDSKFELLMKVASRSWILVNGASPTLVIQLTLEDCWWHVGLKVFNEMLQKQGFPVS